MLPNYAAATVPIKQRGPHKPVPLQLLQGLAWFGSNLVLTPFSGSARVYVLCSPWLLSLGLSALLQVRRSPESHAIKDILNQAIQPILVRFYTALTPIHEAYYANSDSARYFELTSFFV